MPSGPYTVTDETPTGMVAIAAERPAARSPATGRRRCGRTCPSLAPGATTTLTVTMAVAPIPDGLTERPFTNAAEITADSSDTYSSETEAVTDVDSAPDDAATSDADNSVLAEAGAGADVGFDDEDIAVVDTTVVYDLALVKIVDRVTVPIDGTATYTIFVRNQGNVPSGTFTVTDVVPPGLGVVDGSVSDGGTVGLLRPPSGVGPPLHRPGHRDPGHLRRHHHRHHAAPVHQPRRDHRRLGR